MNDRQLSRNFRLSEFSGWQTAPPASVAQLQAFVDDFLQPIRDRWGPIIITSWRTWSSGELRAGGHAAGAVDFVPAAAPIPAVHAWAAHHLRGEYGELIDERDHIHATPPGVGGDGEVLVEYVEGEYTPVRPDGPPRQTLPDGRIWEIPGLTVTVAGPRTWLAWLLLLGAAVGLLERRR